MSEHRVDVKSGGSLGSSKAFAVAVALAVTTPQTTRAENFPTVITPLSTVSDLNHVNLTDGQIRIDLPALGVPAAPRLTLDLVQNAMPYLVARIVGGGAGNYVESFVSVHYGGSASEAFKCQYDDVCASRKVNGSVLGGAIANGGPYEFTLSPNGAVYQFDRLSYDNGPVGSRQTIYYVSSITYPDGEVITYTYDTANYAGGGQTKHRVTQISSSIGYYISFSYQGSDVNYPAWETVAQETLYKATDPSTPLARLTYSGSGMTDLAGRTFVCAGCDYRVGGQIEMSAAAVTLPGESSAAKTVSSFMPIANNYAIPPIVQTVTNDGVNWSYAYGNFRTSTAAQGYSYDNVVVTGPAGYQQTYAITAGADREPNQLTSVTDALGRTTSYGYDINKRPILVILPEGNKVEVVYDRWGNITSKVSTPKLGSALPATTESAAIDAVACSGNQVLCYRITSSTDALGRTTDYAYDTGGRLVQQTDPADADGVRRVRYLTYGASFTAPTVVRVCGLGTTCGTAAETRTEYTYVGATALPLTETRIDAAAGTSLTTSYTYDAAGRVLSVDGPLAGAADARYFRYDAVGRKTWEIGAADAGGVRFATRITYRDADDRVLVTETGTIPSETSTSLTVQSRTDTAYDAHRNPARVAASAGGVTHKVQDASWDDRGQQICDTVRMNAAAFAAAPGACVLGTEGSFGPDRITRKSYDAAGQLTLVQKAYLTSLQQSYAAYTYTPNGKQSSVTDANGNYASMAYDRFDRLSTWTFPSKTVPGQLNPYDYEQYGYDAAGNRTSLRKRDGATLTYAYDNLNRMVTKTVPGSGTGAAGYSVYYGYDVQGLPLYARFGSGSGPGVTTAYDGYGRPTSTTDTTSGYTRTLSYQWDAAGNRTRLTFPDGGFVTASYDGLDRPQAMLESGAAPLAAWSYDAQGRPAQLSRGGGAAVTAWGYDAASRLTCLAHDLAGGGATDCGASTGGVYDQRLGFAYSPAPQMVSRGASNDLYAFGGNYDVDRAYVANGLNQYTSAGPATFAYDANGNLTSDGGMTLAYDSENRLTAASGAKTATLTYDPLGRLASSGSAATGTTSYLYDGDEIVAEYDTNNNLLRRYVHGRLDDDPLVWYEGASLGASSRRYLVPDHQGSIVAVTDASGNALQANSYDPWGIPGTRNLGRFQYTGQAYIPELGMYHYKARVYSPTLGRFLQTDPIGYKDQVNLYAYVQNDPVNHGDPTGLYECSGSKGDCGTISGYVSTAQTALKGLDPKSDAAQKLGATLNYLGKPGEKNGVTIASSSLAKGTLASAGPGGKISVDIKQINAYGANSAFAAANPGTSRADIQQGLGAGALAHEARHELDFNRIGFPNSKASEYRTELNAYRTQQGVDRGLSLTTGMWSPSMSQAQQDAAVAAGAQGSTDTWCRSGGPC